MALSLKRLTAPAHHDAEAAVAALAPLDSRPAYATYLVMLHAFYSAIEPGLFERLDRLLPDARLRQKLPLIAGDLAFLGVVPEPLAVVRPRIDSDAAAMGIAYVLEGKTLGSRFLLAEARSKLGVDQGSGASFFAGYGAETGAMWRGYQTALATFVRAQGRRAAILAGAQATFSAFTRTVRAGG